MHPSYQSAQTIAKKELMMAHAIQFAKPLMIHLQKPWVFFIILYVPITLKSPSNCTRNAITKSHPNKSIKKKLHTISS